MDFRRRAQTIQTVWVLRHFVTDCATAETVLK